MLTNSIAPRWTRQPNKRPVSDESAVGERFAAESVNSPDLARHYVEFHSIPKIDKALRSASENVSRLSEAKNHFSDNGRIISV